jgi:DNA-binding NtrC family response regulator
MNTVRDPLRSPADPKAAPGWRVVVLDTDPGVRWSLEKGLGRSGYEILTATTAGQALHLVNEQAIDAVVMELLPEAGLTLELLSALAQSASAPRMVCISVDSAPHTVIECMRLGAADFVCKPFSLAEIRNALGKILEPRAVRCLQGSKGASQPSLLVGISPATQDLRNIIQKVAQTDLNCLVRGESGVGKDLVAREIHRLSKRSDKSFVKVNCTALPEQLLESELFGYEKGAFTGAVTSKPGRFSLAHKGVIFLDEIGDMHPNLQAKILQVIEHKEFTKLGGTKPVHVDVQIIAATNANLEQKTRDGSFRGDLFFRLNEVCIWVPPLSARKEDVPLLVHHFIQKHSQSTGLAKTDLTGEDLAQLAERAWPGNVRELESTVKRWLVLGKDALGRHTGPVAQVSMPQKEAGANGGADAVSERPEPTPTEIRKTLEENQWNRRKAAECLGISYQALRRRIDKYGLDQPV